MADRFWSFDGDVTDTHETAEAAKHECEVALDWYRDDAGDGWAEVAATIMWGPIAERVVVGPRTEHTPGCEHTTNGGHDACDVHGDVDYTVDYELRPVEVSDEVQRLRRELRSARSVAHALARSYEEDVQPPRAMVAEAVAWTVKALSLEVTR